MRKLDIKPLQPLSPGVNSVQWAPDRKRALICTKGAEVYEIDDTTAENLHDYALVQGHFKDELWGLAVHPNRREAATVGDDKTLRVWDLTTHVKPRIVTLPGMARAVAYSLDGELIAVGLGGDVGTTRAGTRKKEEGRVLLFRAADLSQIGEAQDATRWVSDVKFSPNGRMLAIGAHDQAMYVYDVSSSGLKLRYKFKKHSGAVLHLDFSADGSTIQATGGEHVLLYCTAETGDFQSGGARGNKDTKWATWTVERGWPVEGMWPVGPDYSNIDTVDRSHDQTAFANGDDFGMVNVYRWPAPERDCSKKSYKGHCSHVKNVRWTNKDEFLLSVGGNDKCMFQWAVSGAGEARYGSGPSKEDEGESKAAYGGGLGPAAADDEDSDPLLEADFEQYDPMAKRRQAQASSAPPAADSAGGFSMNGGFQLQGGMGGDEAMAIDPAKGTIAATTPSPPPKSSTEEPSVVPELEWVYGYRSQDCRGNVRYNDAGGIVYHAAAVGIVYDKVGGRWWPSGPPLTVYTHF